MRILIIMAVLSLQILAEDSFDHLKPGNFTSAKSTYGEWIAKGKSTRIYHKSVKPGASLHIMGGENQELILKINGEAYYGLNFYAERWSRTGNFTFKVYGVNGKNRKLVSDMSKLGTGKLHSVSVPLGGKKFESLIFQCSSPKGKGVIIDQVSLDKTDRLIEAYQYQTPVLKNKNISQLLQLKIDLRDESFKDQIKSLTINTKGTTDLKNIEKLYLISTGAKNHFYSNHKVLAETSSIKDKITFKLNHPVKMGAEFLWIGCKLSDKAHSFHKVDAGIESLIFAKAGEQKVKNANPKPIKRIGYSVATGGDNVIRTDGSYKICKRTRIPGLATTNKGTLIAVYDLRWNKSGDLPGDIDVGMSRSTDGGETWSKPKPILDMGEFRNLPQNKNGAGDPAVLVDRKTNTIYVVALFAHGLSSGWYWGKSKAGMDPKDTGQVVIVSSKDDGLTWSKPINITKQIKDPRWTLLLNGPGKGITLKDGTIVFAAQFQEPWNKRRARSSIIYSKDGGKSWKIGTGIPYHAETTEAQIIQLKNGDIMINARISAGGRAVFTTSDLGKTWKQHQTSGNKVLPMVRGCMASIIRCSDKDKGWNKNRLAYSAPDDMGKRRRSHMSIRISEDEGETWGKPYLLDQITGAYSCMTMINNKYIGIIYEGSQSNITFEKIKIEDILGKKIKYPAK